MDTTKSEYSVEIIRDVVGHVAKAIGPDGEILATAEGFGAKDARRKLKAKLGHPTQTLVVTRKRKSRKLHTPAGIIFAAQRNIEKARGKRAGSKNKGQQEKISPCPETGVSSDEH
jgi:hypothetical protein